MIGKAVFITAEDEGAKKLVQACLSARNDRESSLHHGGGGVHLVLACLCSRKGGQTVFTTVKVL